MQCDDQRTRHTARSCLGAALFLLAPAAVTCTCALAVHAARRRPPAPVHERRPGRPRGDDGFPQYWKRNTLLVDLSSAGGSGERRPSSPCEGTTWPVRLAFRVTPRGHSRCSRCAAISASACRSTPPAAQPVDLELAPGVYTPKTPAADGVAGDRPRSTPRSACRVLVALMRWCSAQGTAIGGAVAIQVDGGERAAPHAAGVQPDDAVALHEAQAPTSARR